MKYKVQIDSQTYEVEVGDLNARPIQATVAGETFDVWPEMDSQPVKAVPASAPRMPTVSSASRTAASLTRASADAVHAPIPGVIISIAVQPGTAVSRGQELCMLEAMKMNNAIRSPRDGKVAAVPVSMGQAVKHGDVLITFEP